MSAHHLILGKTTDYITGSSVVDTVDERARQKIARFLVEKKGYSKNDIEVRRKIPLTIDGNKGEATVDFIIRLAGMAFAVIIFGPGSLVTRERLTLAMARLAEDYEIPVSIITNGRDAHIMETESGKVIAEGLDAIPSKKEALLKKDIHTFIKIDEKRLEKERRIVYVFDVLTRKECDDFVCTRC